MIKAVPIETAVPTLFRGDFWKVHDYPGYTTYESWNGWACPNFEKPAADQVMSDLAAEAAETDGVMTLSYDANLDAYNILERSEDDDMAEVVGVARGFDLMTMDGVKHVYAIGAFLWTRQERGVHFNRE